MAINIDNINKKNVIENMRKQIIDTIRYNIILNSFHDDWIPIQEALSNANLLSESMEGNDASEKDAFSLLIEENTKSEIVNYLTQSCEEILNILGCKNGFNFLLTMARAASSPKLFDPKFYPSNKEEFKAWKRRYLEVGTISNLNNSDRNNPTKRFIKMIIFTLENLKNINLKIKKGILPAEIAIKIAKECNCEIQLIDDFISNCIKWLKILSSDEKALRSRKERKLHSDAIRFMTYFQKMLKEENPIYLFANDLKSNKIFFSSLKSIKSYKELDFYLFSNVFLYQYLRSIEESKDYIKCFDNKLTICKLKCKDCEMNILFKASKKLLRITENFTYTDLRREALDPHQLKRALSQ